MLVLVSVVHKVSIGSLKDHLVHHLFSNIEAYQKVDAHSLTNYPSMQFFITLFINYVVKMKINCP